MRITAKNSSLAISLAALLPLMESCATGPTFTQAHATEQPLRPSYARLYFYRPGHAIAVGLIGSIKVDGERAGRMISGSFFYIDKPPGIHKIVVSGGEETSIEAALVAGQTRYVRLDLLSRELPYGSYKLSPTLIDAEQGYEEIKGCRLDAKAATGSTIPVLLGQ